MALLRIQALRLGTVVVWEFREHALSLRAMSLVYTTLLSLVPLLAVMFSVLKAFGAHLRFEPPLRQVLEPLGPKGPEITARIVDFVSHLQVGVLGAAGLAGLFITAVSLLEKVEEALNQVWRVRRARSLARKFSDYLSVVMVGPVLVFSAFGLIASTQSHWVVRRVLEPLGGLPVSVAGRVLPFLFLCAAFTFLYRFMPHTQVRCVSALVGGATAAVLWQLVGFGFTAFVAGSPRYTAIYSGFAALVLFLLWLYAAWLVVLVGAEVAYLHQYPSAYLTAPRRHGSLFRERMALAALAEIARRHLSGNPPPRAAELSDALAVPLSSLEEVLDGFVDCGIILRAAEPEGVALARPPDEVTLLEALQVLDDPDHVEPAELPQGQGDAISAVLRLRDRALRQAVGGLTLRSLAFGIPVPDEGTFGSPTRARR
jgi:membrane protein